MWRLAAWDQLSHNGVFIFMVEKILIAAASIGGLTAFLSHEGGL